MTTNTVTMKGTTTMTETTTKRVRTTAFVTGVAKGERITKTKTYSLAEDADLWDVSIYAVRRWVTLGYVQSIKESVEGTNKHVHTITGEALVDFFAARKEHKKGVAARRAERGAKAAARAEARQKDEPAVGA